MDGGLMLALVSSFSREENVQTIFMECEHSLHISPLTSKTHCTNREFVQEPFKPSDGFFAVG
jgi:hypothetical protein